MVAEKEAMHRQRYHRLLLTKGDIASSTAWPVRNKAVVELPLPFSPAFRAIYQEDQPAT